MMRVVATFSTNLPSVVANNTVGKTLNSNGAATYTVVSRIITEIAMFPMSSKSSNSGGTGESTTNRQIISPMGSISSEARGNRDIDSRSVKD